MHVSPLRWLFVIAGVLAPVAVFAQNGPSPFAPGDLKRPIFDTSRPAYDTAELGKDAAKTLVAEVEGRPVTLGDVSVAIAQLPPVEQALPFDKLFDAVREQLIEQQALIVQAARAGFDIDPSVRTKIGVATAGVVSEAYLEQEVSKTITEQALLDRFKREVEGKPGPEEVQLRIIVTSSEGAALGVIEQLRNGAAFDAVARKSSNDVTARSGGDLGFVARDRLGPEVGAVAFCLSPGDFTRYPVAVGESWFVLKVEARRRGQNLAYSAVRQDLRNSMFKEVAPSVIGRSMDGLKVRRFDLTGAEVQENSPSPGGSPE